jgi:hypothetical protein
VQVHLEFRWNCNSKCQLQSCIRDRQSGGLASEYIDSLVFRCSDSCRCRPISYSVERWSPSNKYQLQPNIRDRYLHCQVYFWFYFIVTDSCCGRVPSRCKLSDLCPSGMVSAAVVVQQDSKFGFGATSATLSADCQYTSTDRCFFAYC